MRLATLSYHDPNCSGCPACSARHAVMLDETPTQTAMRCAVETRAMVLRFAAQPTRKTESEWREHWAKKLQGYGTIVTETPDPYASATYRVKPAPCPYDSPDYAPHGQPPDPYAAGIDRLRKEKK